MELTFEDFLRLGNYLYHLACRQLPMTQKYYEKARLNR